MENLDKLITEINKVLYPNPSERCIQIRNKILHDLNQILTNNDCSVPLELQLYGSSINGLGNINSDIDVCINPMSWLENEDKLIPLVNLKVLENFKNDLISSNLNEFTFKKLVCHAPVPVLKLIYVPTNTLIDITACQPLVHHHSNLLRIYSKIDSRVRLTYNFLKEITRQLNIHEEWKNGFSSYALALMTIHFCQNIQPPILPYLQDSDLLKKVKNDNKIDLEVCGYTIQYVKNVVDWTSRNNLSIGQVWLSLCKYFTVMDVEHATISIRHNVEMIGFSKTNEVDGLNIPDPFEFGKNLAKDLSKENKDKLWKVFKIFITINLSLVDFGFDNYFKAFA